MKKIFLYILVVSIICVSGIVFASCKDASFDLIYNNMAEIRQSIWAGENKKFKCTLMCGKRETDYKINGYATSLIEFGVVTVVNQTNEELTALNFVLITSNNSFSGSFEINPFDNSFVTDIKHIISDDIVKLKIYDGVDELEIQIENLSNSWQINYLSALEIAYNKNKSDLKTIIEDNKFLGEAYIKLLENNETNSYFWCIKFVGRNGLKISTLIDINSGDILANEK